MRASGSSHVLSVLMLARKSEIHLDTRNMRLQRDRGVSELERVDWPVSTSSAGYANLFRQVDSSRNAATGKTIGVTGPNNIPGTKLFLENSRGLVSLV